MHNPLPSSSICTISRHGFMRWSRMKNKRATGFALDNTRTVSVPTHSFPADAKSGGRHAIRQVSQRKNLSSISGANVKSIHGWCPPAGLVFYLCGRVPWPSQSGDYWQSCHAAIRISLMFGKVLAFERISTASPAVINPSSVPADKSLSAYKVLFIWNALALFQVNLGKMTINPET